MKTKQIVNVGKALTEKEHMQKTFICDNGHPSSVLALLIVYFEGEKGKKRR